MTVTVVRGAMSAEWMSSGNALNRVALRLHPKTRADGVQIMIVGAVIAAFIIVSLLLETISSSPKADKAEQPDVTIAPQ